MDEEAEVTLASLEETDAVELEEVPLDPSRYPQPHDGWGMGLDPEYEMVAAGDDPGEEEVVE